MNFRESELFLLSLGNEVSAMKLGLENIRKLLGALDNPENNYLKVQIAGTNGKGSVCAFLDSILGEAGIIRGVFTSPHLVSITERIRINGTDISEAEFARFATRVRGVAEEMLAANEIEYRPTFFEQVTAIALLAFAEAGVELAILETGLGGRLDATTAANAEIVAITRIDIDHQEYLGETIEEIAAEKAAIIHAGSRVVVGDQQPAAEKVISARIRSLGVQAKWAAEGPPVRLGLVGVHQVENANIAIAAADLLHEHFSITEQNIIDGLQNARHPGRLEFKGRYLFDGAHNVSGAAALRAFIDKEVTQSITMIFGAMKGKDIGQIAQVLFSRAENLILTQPDNSRAMSPVEIERFVPPDVDQAKVLMADTVGEAIDLANELASDDGLILITGSLYLVGEAKKILNN